MADFDYYPAYFPSLARLGPSGLFAVVEMRPPSPREALEAEALRREAERLAADIAEQKRVAALLDEGQRLFAGMTDAERAELRFALRCDPELRPFLGDIKGDRACP